MLVKFPVETFKNNNIDYRFTEFNDALNMAEEGTYSYDYNDYNDYDNSDDDVFGVVGSIFAILFNLGIPVHYCRYCKSYVS